MFRFTWAILTVYMLTLPVITLGQPALDQPPAQPPAADDVPPPTPPPAESTRGMTPSEILDRVEGLLDQLKQANRDGRMLEARNIYQTAVTGIQAVLQQDPKNVRAKLLFGELAWQGGDYNTARDNFKAVLDVDRNNFRANLGMGRYYIASRIWRQAAFFLETAERVAPADQRGEALRLLSQAYNGQGLQDKAENAAQRAVDLDPNDFEALQTLVAIRLAKRDYDRALENAQALVDVARDKVNETPEDTVALQRLLIALEAHVNVLRDYFRSLFQRDSRNRATDILRPGEESEAAAVLKRIGEQLEQQNAIRTVLNYHEILLLIEKALEYDPDNPEYLMEAGRLYANTNQTAAAIERFRQVLEQDPNHTGARQALQRLGATPAPTTPDQ